VTTRGKSTLEVAIIRFLRLVILVTRKNRIRTEDIRRQIYKNVDRKMMSMNIICYTLYKEWKKTEYRNVPYTKDD
jgi:hypothetical protein